MAKSILYPLFALAGWTFLILVEASPLQPREEFPLTLDLRWT